MRSFILRQPAYLGLLFLLLAGPVAPVQAEPSKNPVIVELFTSQSCSSCPAADRLLEEIAHNPDNGLIVLGCHVTYWDHLRWKDTLSLEACTERQREYAGILEQGRTYSPNMIVNGISSFGGSDKGDLGQAIRKARQKNEVARIDIQMTPEGFEVELPDLPAGQKIPYELTVLTYTTNQTVEIKSGENHGKSITYAHAVSGIKRLPAWQGHKEHRRIAWSALAADKLHGVVVIAQPVRGGKIRAAGEYRIYFN